MSIELQNVEFAYDPKTPIFRDLSLKFANGDIVSIIGNSGCGKTTLLNLIAGVLTPTKGIIKRIDSSMSYLMQNITLLPYRTTLENTLLSCELRGIPVNDKKNAAINLLQYFNIEPDAFDKFPEELSGGMIQRVGLIQTLLTDTSLVLLDEPFNAIDINALSRIKQYIWEHFVNNNKTMIFITHNIDQALQLSNRIIIMYKSAKLSEITPSVKYCSLSPEQRMDTIEYKNLFFDIIDKLKYES